MNNPTKKISVPRLRFPEFWGAGEWEEKTLGNEGEFFSSLTGKAGADFDTGEARFVTYTNVFCNTFVNPKALRLVNVPAGENQTSIVNGDVFFTISSETPDEVGMSSVLLEKLDNCYLNSFCALFRFSENKRPNPVFTGYLLRQPLVRAYFTKKAQGSTRFNLSKASFRNLPLLVPAYLEQQKIADCLSSIDALITAQSQKVEALKTHKKGLMQQLFPTDGETIPRQRFPAFQDKGRWETKTLKEISTINQGLQIPISKRFTEKVENSYFYITNEFLKENSKTTYYIKNPQSSVICDEHDILMTRTGNTGLVVTGVSGGFHNNFLKIKHSKNISRHFFVYFLRSENTNKTILKLAGASTIPDLNHGDFYKIQISVPCLVEQQKIAACLSSIDTLITAQTQKLAALKTHKKGLMQQLFPSANEVVP